MRSGKLIVVILLLFSFSVSAQEELNESIIRQNIVEQRIETIVESLEEEEELDYTTLFEELIFYYDHPLNLNRANDQELKDLNLLSDVQIINLQRHIDKYGKLDSQYELQAIPGFDINTIYLILPFVRVREEATIGDVSLKDILEDGRSDLFVRYEQTIEDPRGFTPISNEDLAANPNSRYLGSKPKLYTRYRFTYRNMLSVGFTAEKDQGEEFFTGTQKQGFDFYSGHLHYRGRGTLSLAHLGDYQVNFGQGLALWSGLAFGKSSSTMLVKRSPRGIRPYTSVDENRFLRGAAATISTGPIQTTVFYSKKRIDANITNPADSLDQGEEVRISSFQLSGFHRTESEVFDKDALGEEHMGGHVEYRSRRLKIGASGLASRYEGEVSRNLTFYNQFDFNSNENWVAAFDYNLVLRNFNFFGEQAMSQNGGMAYLNGVLMALHPKFSVSVLHRKYERDFHSVLGNAIAESSRPANESGLYIGSEVTLSKGWKLFMYYDQFKFPWLRFRTDAPSDGYDALVQLNHKPSRRTELYIRYRDRRKSRNYNLDEELIDYITDTRQSYVRLNAAYNVTPSVKLKTRIEASRWQQDPEEADKGFLLAQDISIKPLESPFTLNLRYALFETESYDARIYAYESDVLYGFSIPAYFSTGSRIVAVLKYRVRRGLDLWLRYAQWYYTDRNVISSGLNEIQGSKRTDIKVQVRYRF